MSKSNGMIDSYESDIDKLQDERLKLLEDYDSLQNRYHIEARARLALQAENDRLRAELISVLDIAIKRGDSLGYLSEDYCSRLEALQGGE